MKYLYTILLTCFAIGFLMASPADAQTPDGQTPADEGDCDILAGGTPGLFGLCVAYCEAHDADLVSPFGDLEKLDAPNRKILLKYRNRMRTGDPDMPCVEDPCPCWSADQLASIDGISTETVDPSRQFQCRNSPAIRTVIEDGWIEQNVDREALAASTLDQGFRKLCDLERLIWVDGIKLVHTRKLLTIDDEEYATCRAQIDDHCEAFGIPDN